MTEARLARIAWAAAGGLLLVLAYAIAAPSYMGFNRPSLVERPEFVPLIGVASLAGAFLYLVTRDERMLLVIAVMLSAIVILALIAVLLAPLGSFFGPTTRPDIINPNAGTP